MIISLLFAIAYGIILIIVKNMLILDPIDTWRLAIVIIINIVDLVILGILKREKKNILFWVKILLNLSMIFITIYFWKNLDINGSIYESLIMQEQFQIMISTPIFGRIILALGDIAIKQAETKSIKNSEEERNMNKQKEKKNAEDFEIIQIVQLVLYVIIVLIMYFTKLWYSNYILLLFVVVFIMDIVRANIDKRFINGIKLVTSFIIFILTLAGLIEYQEIAMYSEVIIYAVVLEVLLDIIDTMRIVPVLRKNAKKIIGVAIILIISIIIIVTGIKKYRVIRIEKMIEEAKQSGNYIEITEYDNKSRYDNQVNLDRQIALRIYGSRNEMPPNPSEYSSIDIQPVNVGTYKEFTDRYEILKVKINGKDMKIKTDYNKNILKGTTKWGLMFSYKGPDDYSADLEIYLKDKQTNCIIEIRVPVMIEVSW